MEPLGSVKRISTVGLYVLGLVGMAQLWLSFVALTGAPTDFIQEYLLACALERGLDPALPVKELAALCDPTIDTSLIPRNHAAAHLPIWGILVYPLALLPFAQAQKVWFFLGLATMFGIFRTLTRQPLSSVVAMTAAASLTYPVAAQLQLGQVDAVITLCFAIALLALERRRDGAAGAWVGLAMALKLSGWLAWVWVICAGKRRMSNAAILALVGLQAVQLICFGRSAVIHYYTVTLSEIGGFYVGAFDNLSVLSLPRRAFQGMHGKVDESLLLRPLIEAPHLVNVLSISMALAGAMLGFYAARKLPQAAGFTMCVAASQPFAPVLWAGSFVVGIMVFTLSYERCAVNVTRFATWCFGLCIFATAPISVPEAIDALARIVRRRSYVADAIVALSSHPAVRAATFGKLRGSQHR